MKSYYSLTEDGFSLLEKGGQRIFERKPKSWDGMWSIVVYFIPEEKRKARDQLRQELSWMGYGPLSTATWISSHDLTREVEEIAKKLEIRENVQIFQAQYQGFSSARSIISRGWDLDWIHKRYASFIAEYRPKLENHLRRLKAGETVESSECFVERFKLTDEYRRLPFFDPDLPEELLPKNWLRSQAAALFHDYYDLLAERANEYFELLLSDYRAPQLTEMGKTFK